MENLQADAIAQIERLVNAQHNKALLSTEVTIDDRGSFLYAVDASANGRTIGRMIQPPRPELLSVSTLTGFVDAFKAIGQASSLFVHVEDHLTVAVKQQATDRYGVRDTILRAKHTPFNAFAFDQYYNDPQRFIIALQAQFLNTDELLYLIRIASNLKAGNSVHTQDDGFNQTVTLKVGEVETAEHKLKPRIKLIPMMTFPEASECEREFLIRLKQSPQETPSIALFAVDGTKWQGDLMRSIKSYLEKHLPKETQILA